MKYAPRLGFGQKSKIFERARKSKIFDIHPESNPLQDLNPEAIAGRWVSAIRYTRFSDRGMESFI